jgi:outer membrane biosynthesis protein TonB
VSEAEVLPSTTKPTPKPVEKTAKTDRPTANQTEQLVAQKPLQGKSTNTNVEIGRSFGSQTPAMTGGVGVSSGANLGTGGVPGGSEYGRRIQMILGRNYNPPATNDANGTQYVIVQLRIARDGRILSLVNGRVGASYLKQRSSNELVNYAAERAVLISNPLPPFPNGFLIGAQEAVAEIWFRYPK